MIHNRKRLASGASNAMLVVAGLYVTMLSIIGGGNLVFGPITLFVMAATSLFVGASALLRSNNSEAPFEIKLSLLLIVAIPLLQLIPLPPAVWQSLPGQDVRSEVLALIGKSGSWQPLSLGPVDTAYTAVMAAGFASLVLVFLALDATSFQRTLLLIFALVGLGILVGVVQVASGTTFPNLFSSVDSGALIGFYSNKNHMALAVSASILIAYALLIDPKRRGQPVIRLLFFVYWAVAMIAVIATTSRAGLALGVLASLVVALSMAQHITLRQRLFIAGGALLLCGLVAVSAPFQAMLARFDYIDDDNRWLFTIRSLPLIQRYWTTGAGGGVFSDLFITSEPLEWVKPTIMNHVHNDYLEMVIEYGVLGVVAAAALALGLARAALRIRSLADPRARAMRSAGLVIVALIALHSVVDYPLRRPALLVIFAAGIAMTLRETNCAPLSLNRSQAQER